MKRKTIMILLLAMIILSSVIGPPGEKVKAEGFAEDIPYSKTLSLSFKKNNSTYMFYMPKQIKASDTVTVKSSKASVVRPLAPDLKNWPTFQLKKPGKATLTITVKHKNGKKNTYKSKITVYKYTNPFSSCVLGDNDIKNSFNTYGIIKASIKGNEANVRVAVKKGWTIKSIRYRVKLNISTDKAYVPVANNSVYIMDPTCHAFRIIVFNKSKNLTEDYYIDVTDPDC